MLVTNTQVGRQAGRRNATIDGVSVRSGSIDLVAFDLGGVLAGFDGVAALKRLTSLDNEDELWRRWLTCRWVRAFESGQCTAEEFASGVVADWELPLSPPAFLAAFEQWLTGPYEGADELLAQARQQLPVACLSNTNETHWAAGAKTWPLMSDFDYRFLSFQTGLLKPDEQVFRHVCEVTGLPPARILFLDDNAINVEAAVRFGLAAVRVRGVVEARQALIDAGVIDDIVGAAPQPTVPRV